MQFDLRPLNGPFGMEVVGIDPLREIPAGVARALREAWYEHSLLLFRGLNLDTEQHLRFARVFGEIQEDARAIPGYNYVSNVIEDGLNPAGPLGFHTDHSMEPEMLLGIMLYALEAPPPGEGGETLFANVRLAYRDLPDRLKQRIEGLVIRHGNPDTSIGIAMPPLVTGRDARRADRPLALSHPVTKERLLFLSRRHADKILGLPEEESTSLIDELTSYVQRPELIYAHSWRRGDLVIWDNYALQHGRNDFDPKWKRHLRRIQIAEPPPRAAAS